MNLARNPLTCCLKRNLANTTHCTAPKCLVPCSHGGQRTLWIMDVLGLAVQPSGFEHALVSFLEGELCSNNVGTWLSYWYTAHSEGIWRQKQAWQESGRAHDRGGHRTSRPLSAVKADAADSCTALLRLHQLESIKARQTALHPKVQHGFRQHTKAPRAGQERTSSDAASRQAVSHSSSVSLRSLGAGALASGSENAHAHRHPPLEKAESL